MNVPGSYAQRLGAPGAAGPGARRLPPEVAAAALLQGLTADYLVADSYPVQPGDWVLVHAAAGGVGLLLTQLVKLRGGRVIGRRPTEEKAELAREAGADEVIGYEDFAERVREITGGEGAAVVYDGVGGTTFAAGLTALRPTGSMILYGAASGQPEPLDAAVAGRAGSLYVQRPTLKTYTRTPASCRSGPAGSSAWSAPGSSRSGSAPRYPLARPGGPTRTSRRAGPPASCSSPVGVSGPDRRQRRRA